MNPGKRGPMERGSGKGGESRPSPAMHDRSSGKHSPASSHSPANKCGSIPLLSNEINRAAAANFLANFTGSPGFTPPVWQDLQYLINPLAPSFMPPIPFGLDMFSAPFLQPMPGSAPGLFPPGLPLLRPPGGATGLLHSPYTALFPNVNDVPVHLLSKPDQSGSRPRSAKKTSSLASSSSESDIAGRTSLAVKHDPKPSHSSKQFWHGAAEVAKCETRKRLSESPAVSKSKQDEVVDVINYSDRDSPLELTVKKTNKEPVHEKLYASAEDIQLREDVSSQGSSEMRRVMPSEQFPVMPARDDGACLSLVKFSTPDSCLKQSSQSSGYFVDHAAETVLDRVREELKEKPEGWRPLTEPQTENFDQAKVPCVSGTEFEIPQISGSLLPPRQSIALPPRKRLTRNPEELGLGVPSQSSGSDSPSSTSNFRLYWKKFAAKANHNGQPSHRTFISSGKPMYDCRNFFQKMAAKDACKSAILMGKAFIGGKSKGFYHRSVSRTSPRFSRNEGGTGVPPDGSTSPRVTRSQSKLKQKKSAGSPKSSPTEPPMPVRKSLRKKTANSKYEAEDVVKTCSKGSNKKDSPPKGGVKNSGKNADKEAGKCTKVVDPSEIMEDSEAKKPTKPYSLRDREEKGRGRGSKSSLKDGSQKLPEASSGILSGIAVTGGICKVPSCNSALSESSTEISEKKKDDSFEEKGNSSRHLDHDGKSVSSGISTSSMDVVFEPEVLSLPPKFRRAKRKTVSTSHSVSSIEDDRSVEGVKDVKIDLCRTYLDPDAVCCKNPSVNDTNSRQSEITVDEDTRNDSKVASVQLESAIEFTKQMVSAQLDGKSVQKQSEISSGDAEKKQELEKIPEVEISEKKLDAEKQPEGKIDKPTRSTGGKKSLLYRSSLSSNFDEFSSSSTTKSDLTQLPSAVEISGREPSITVEEEPVLDQKLDDTNTNMSLHKVETGKSVTVAKMFMTEEVAITGSNSKIDNTKSVSKEKDSDSIRPGIEQPRVRSIVEFTAVSGATASSAQDASIPCSPLLQLETGKGAIVGRTETMKVVSKDSSEVFPSDNSEAKASVKQDAPIIRESSCSETITHKEADAGLDVVCQERERSSPAVVSESKVGNTDDADRSEYVAEKQEHLQDSNTSQAKAVQSVNEPVQSSIADESSSAINTVANQSSTFSVSACAGGPKIPSTTEEDKVPGTVEALVKEPMPVISKKRMSEGSSVLQNKKPRKGENRGSSHSRKIVNESFHRVEEDDVQDLLMQRQDIDDVRSAASRKNAPMNPLHFYSHSKILALPLNATDSLGSQGDAALGISSSPDVGHSEMTSGIRRPDPIPGQSSRPVSRMRLDASAEPTSSALDSEPPILEKTNFTYMEQFSDISDTEENENRDPPMLEVTSDCGPPGVKPCSNFALDKHILFAKIASTTLNEGGTSRNSTEEQQADVDHASRKGLAQKCKPFVDSKPRARTGSDSHSAVSPVHYQSDPVIPSSIPSMVSQTGASDLVTKPTSSVSPDVNTANQSSANSQKSNNSRKTGRKGSRLTGEQKNAPTPPNASDVRVSSSNKQPQKESSFNNSTLSTGDLELCGIALTPLPCTVTDITNRKVSPRGKGASRSAPNSKNDNNLDSLLQHCKSFSVVVQKIDGSQKPQQSGEIEPEFQANYKPANEEVERLNAKVRKIEVAKRTGDVHTGPADSEAAQKSDEMEQTLSRSTRASEEKSYPRKRKQRAIKEVEKVVEPEELPERKQNWRDVKKMEATENLSSVYDFEKDQSSMDFSTPLYGGKEFSRSYREEGNVTQMKRPLRLKFLVAEHSPLDRERTVATATEKGRDGKTDAISKFQKSKSHNDEKSDPMLKQLPNRSYSDEKYESASKPVKGKSCSNEKRDTVSKSVKEVREKDQESSSELPEKLSNEGSSNLSAVGHVKCRLIKVGRHQWMSLGDTNVQETQHKVPSDARSVSSAQGLSDVDSLPEVKNVKEPTKKSRHSRNAASLEKTQAQTQNKQPIKKKREKCATKAAVVRDEISFSDVSVRSFDQVENAVVLSPHSSVDQSSRCSETESVSISAGAEPANTAANVNVRIPDFLDALLGDDIEDAMFNVVQKTKDVDSEAYIRCALERANFGKLSDTELDDYTEVLSPASTFFVPSDIEMQLAKMTLSDHFDNDKPTVSTSFQSNSRTEKPLSTVSRNFASGGVVAQVNEKTSKEVDQLLTQANEEDGDEDVGTHFGDDLMEEFVSWLSPPWDDTCLNDVEDPWSSLNLLSPSVDLSKPWQRLHT